MANKKPVLVIMAAGMGSRFGGLKQIEPMDEYGHIIMDYSLYDARLAGFEKVIFIIKKENEEIFRERIGDRAAKHMEVAYAFQDLTDLPEGFEVPEGRVKPWGTSHAILAARHLIDGPFAVINADDYYGREAFAQIYDYLVSHEDTSTDDGNTIYRYAMVSYVLKNTLTENGHVARGVCNIDENGFLTGITERTKIMRRGDEAAYTEDDEKTWNTLPLDTPVSMNLWGFSKSLIAELEKDFPRFLSENIPQNPLKCEYFLPFAVDDLLKAGKASVKVLHTKDRWYGVTYKEDKANVCAAFAAMEKEGKYPSNF